MTRDGGAEEPRDPQWPLIDVDVARCPRCDRAVVDLVHDCMQAGTAMTRREWARVRACLESRAR